MVRDNMLQRTEEKLPWQQVQKKTYLGIFSGSCNFTEKKGKHAKCKQYTKKVQGLIVRMKHYTIYFLEGNDCKHYDKLSLQQGKFRLVIRKNSH